MGSHLCINFKGRIPTGDLILPCPRSTNPCYREITYTPATLGWWETPSTTQRCKGMPYTPWSLPPKTLGFQKTSKDPTRIKHHAGTGDYSKRIKGSDITESELDLRHGLRSTWNTRTKGGKKPLLTDPSFPKGCHNFLINKNQEDIWENPPDENNYK